MIFGTRKTGKAEAVLNNPAKIEKEIDWPQVQPPKVIITRYAEALLTQLRSVISVTSEQYQLYYEQAIHALAHFAQIFPGELNPHYHKEGGFVCQALERTIAALKYRRGYMLPVGADTETCYREHDQWTFAIFTASLLRDTWQLVARVHIEIFDKNHQQFQPYERLCDGVQLPINTFYRFKFKDQNQLLSSINTIIAKELLSRTGWQWLSQNQLLFKVWLDYLVHVTSDTVIGEICERAHQVTLGVNQTENSNEGKVESERSMEIIATNAPQDATLAIALADEPVEEKVIGLPLNRTITEPVVIKESLADQFMAWLKQAMANKTLMINEKDAPLHVVDKGLLLIMPKLFEAFRKTAQADINYQQLIESTSQMSTVLPSSHANNLHSYYLGQWHERNVVFGILLPLDTFFDNRVCVEKSSLCHPELELY